MIHKTSGVILKEVNTQDSDKMLTVLTTDLGKIRVSAKHVRNSKKNSGVSFLNFSELVLAEGNDVYFLRQSGVIESFYELSENIKTLALATYMAQLASEVVPEGVESGETLSLLLNTYYVLAKKGFDLKTAKLVFEIKLLSLHGLLPDFSGCYDCGQNGTALFFDILTGNVRCANCTNIGFKLNTPCLNVINYVVNSNVKRIFSFTASNEITDYLSEIIEKYCISQIGRKLNSLDYYNCI